MSEDVQSVGDSVRAAIESLQEQVDEPAGEVVEEVEATEPDPGEEPEPEEEHDGEPEPEEEPEAEEADGDGGKEEPEEVILPPASWSKEDREHFAKLDKDVQKIVARREGERDRFVQANSRETAPVRAVLDEHADYFRQVGLDPATSIDYLIKAEKALRYGTPQAKREKYLEIARQYGIELPTATSPEPSEELADPDLAAALKPVVERLGTIEGQLSSRQQADDRTQEMEAANTASDFFSELEAMDPKQHPEVRYVQDVMPLFQAMVTAERQNGKSLDVNGLKRLYTDAAWGTPQVREAMQSDMAASQKPKAEVRKKTVKRSSSASSGSGSPAHSEDLPEHETVRESIQRSIRQLENGAMR